MVPMARDGPIQALFWLEWALSWPTRRRADLRILIRNIDEVAVSATTVHQGDLLTYAFPVWNMGPGDASKEVLLGNEAATAADSSGALTCRG
jgi:hypothetical protein